MKQLTPEYILVAIGVMFAVTYGLRMVSLVLFRRKLKNRFVFSFLTYTPYGVLSAMIFPDIFLFTQTGATFGIYEFVCAAVGCVVAVGLSLLKRGLITVSLGAVGAVFLAQQICNWIM